MMPNLRIALFSASFMGWLLWSALVGLSPAIFLFSALAYAAVLWKRLPVSDAPSQRDGHPAPLSVSAIDGLIPAGASLNASALVVSTVLNPLFGPSHTLATIFGSAVAVFASLAFGKITLAERVPTAVAAARARDFGCMAMAAGLPPGPVYIRRHMPPYSSTEPIEVLEFSFGRSEPLPATPQGRALRNALARPFFFPVTLKMSASSKSWGDGFPRDAAKRVVGWTPPSSAHQRLKDTAHGHALLARKGILA